MSKIGQKIEAILDMISPYARPAMYAIAGGIIVYCSFHTLPIWAAVLEFILGVWLIYLSFKIKG